MKYCIDFNKNNIPSDIDEINIQYDKILSLEALTKLNNEQNKRFNICFNEENATLENVKKILDLNNKNFYLKFIKRTPEIDKIKETYKDIKLFFDIKANTWSTFIGLVNYRVTDIYITELLGFELDKISKIAKNNNIQIRTFPNIAQTSWTDNNDITKFWIRPEDISIYEPYIDVCEFYGDINNFNIYYKIYKKDKKWFGNLKEIIIDLQENLDSRFIIPEFAQKRTRCGCRCLKGDNCKLCYEIIDLSKSLEKANLIVTKKKKEEEEERNG